MMFVLPINVFSQSDWSIDGNTLAVGKNKLGSINSESVVFISNNIERMRLLPNGNFGIGTTNPQQSFHVNGNIRFSALSSGTQTSAIMLDANGDLSTRVLNISNWDAAYSWGNHAGLYRPVSWVPTWTDVTSKPSFALVATSGSYNDLLNLPSLFDGNYNSLSNLPTLFDGNWSSLNGSVPQISLFTNDAGYITSPNDADADPLNEIQDLDLVGNILTITNNGTATEIDLSQYLDDTDTHLTESEVDAMVSNNGYLTSFTELDGDITNEIQDLQLNGNILTITNNGTATQIDLSQYLDDTDTHLTESEVDAMVSNNGYLTSFTELDGDPTNELQSLSFNGDQLSLSNGNSVSLSGLNYWTKQNNNLYYNIGMVGVGISTPQKQMHIHNPNNVSLDDEISGDLQPGPKGLQMKSESALLLTNKNSGSAATDGLVIRSTNNNAYIYLQEAGNLEILTKKPLRFKMESNGNVAIGTVQTNYFVVKETGKIGIKTNDPTATFDINGDLRIRQGASENYVLTSNSNGTGQWKEIKLALNGNTLSLVNHNTQVDLSGFNQTLSLVDQSLQLSNGGGSVALNNLNYWSKNGSMIYYNLGNVGIGTNDPQAALHVIGNKILLEENGNKLFLDASDGGVKIGSSTNQVAFWYAGNYCTIKTGDIISDGNVGIGTTTPSCKLEVNGIAKFGISSSYIRVGKIGSSLNIDSYGGDLNINRNTGKDVYFGGEMQVGDRMKVNQSGKIWAQEIKVALNDPYPDYVFKPDYDLMDIEELEAFIKTNGHLPDVPNEESVISNSGYDLGAFCIILLEKIEELTLYTIEQEKRIKELENNLQYNPNK
jgi:hypothetical protein